MLLPGVKIEYIITDVKKSKSNNKSNNNSNKNNKNNLVNIHTTGVSTRKSHINKDILPSSSPTVNRLNIRDKVKYEVPSIVMNTTTSTVPISRQRVSPRCYSPRKKVDPILTAFVADGWNISTTVPNRDDLIREQDNHISKVRLKKNNWMVDENEKEILLQSQEKRLIQKDHLGVHDTRDRFPSKVFCNFVNNPFPSYPHLKEDPVMVALNHGKWDVGSDRYSDVPTRSLPEKPSKNHDTFAKQYRIKNDKRVDQIVVSQDISEIEDLKNY